jgi:hypothetical protein
MISRTLAMKRPTWVWTSITCVKPDSKCMSRKTLVDELP